jgi:hypothetical protein
MELTIIAIAVVAAIVTVAAVSRRIEVAAPLSLVAVGIALSFLPRVPEINVDPKWILAGALPPARIPRVPSPVPSTPSTFKRASSSGSRPRGPDLADPTRVRLNFPGKSGRVYRFA